MASLVRFRIRFPKGAFMIVDTHRHGVAEDWFSASYWAEFIRHIMPLFKRWGAPENADELADGLPAYLSDPDGDRHVEAMRRAGIDRCVVFISDFGLLSGEPDMGLVAQNEAVFRMAKKHHSRIVPFVGTDPRRTGAPIFVRKCVENWGAKGIKLHPGAGFDLKGRHCLKLFEAAADLQVPVIVHTGPTAAPARSETCDPVDLTEALESFPEVPVIAAHMAHGRHGALFEMARKHDNLYTDISGWQVRAARDYDGFARAVHRAVSAFGPERILFGTDSPYYGPVLSESEYIEAVRGLGRRAPEDARLSPETVDLILGRNAQRLFYL